jgi:histone deacetylase 6
VAERDLQQQVTSLVCYLWDNYIQMYEAEDIFLMGVGNAYLGVKMLLINRSESKDRLSGVVNFVSGNLRPVKSDADETLSAWYRDNSRVYVAADHACWQDHELTRKVQKKRFGAVERSSERGLNKMMAAHATQTQEFILSRLRSGSDDDEDGDDESGEEGDTTEDEGGE